MAEDAKKDELAELLDEEDDSQDEVQKDEQDTEETQSEPDKQNLEKKLEQMNYQFANFQKEITNRLDSLQQREEPDDKPDPYDQIRQSAGDDYEDPVVTKLLEHQKVSTAETRAVLQRIQEQQEATAASLRELQARDFKEKFLKENEDFTDEEYESVRDSTRKYLKERLDGLRVDGEALSLLADEAWRAQVLTHRQGRKSGDQLNEEPDKPTKGAKVKAGTVTRGRVTEKSDEQLLDDAIDDFLGGG